jgi:signal transduction histidine kinase/CheY-like chemotaxis protein
LTGTVSAAALGKPVREVLRLVGSDESPLERALRAGQRIELSEAQLVNLGNGAVRMIADSAAPVVDGDQHLGAVMVFRDITEQRRLQQQLELADRLASLGTLAAGIAHEVNNPLTVAAGNIELLALDLAELRAELEVGCASDISSRLSSMTSTLVDARSAIRRIASIVSDLQAFCRPQPGPVNHADVARCLEWALRASAQELKHRARVVTDAGALPHVALEETRLGQVLINLLVNAAQALSLGDIQDNVVKVTARATPKGSVVIEVQDTGPGIPKEALPHIFEPFFTTKARGIGTGLGLSICHGIVAAAGGTIEAISEPGRGTTMRVTLPIAKPPEPESSAISDKVPVVRGKILVIDDEPIVLKVLGRALHDHDVVCLTSAQAALERLALGEHFDLILTDLIMPTMTGMAFYERLVAERPELCRRVVFVTGGPVGGQLEDFIRTVPNPVLSKPFDLHALQRTIQRLLLERVPAPK